MKSWFHPSKTIAKRNASEIDEMGVWARIKRKLAQRWLGQITLAPGSGDLEMGISEGEGEFSTVTELLQTSAPIAMADGDPRVAIRMGSPPFRRFAPRGRSRSSSGSRRGDRPLSPGSEMVVEEATSDDEGSASGKEKEKVKDKGGSPTRAGGRRNVSEVKSMRGGLLNVPLSIRRGDEHAP